MLGDGKGLFDQVARACGLILISAICLYCAVQLLCAVWQMLAVAGGLVVIGIGGVALWRWRQMRW